MIDAHAGISLGHPICSKGTCCAPRFTPSRRPPHSSLKEPLPLRPSGANAEAKAGQETRNVNLARRARSRTNGTVSDKEKAPLTESSAVRKSKAEG